MNEEPNRNKQREYILCAAIRRVTPRTPCGDSQPYHLGTNDIMDIELGFRHHDIFNRFGKEVSRKPEDQGFYTSTGRFVDRVEAMRIAFNAGQVEFTIAIKSTRPMEFNRLHSEDLY